LIRANELKLHPMKLSEVLLATLLVSGMSAAAQNELPNHKVDTNKVLKPKLIQEAPKDSVKATKVKRGEKTRPITPDYCPPCGMG
jgi:hypothetical protein